MKKTRNARRKYNRRQKRRTRVNKMHNMHDIGRGRLRNLLAAATVGAALANPHIDGRQRLLSPDMYMPTRVPERNMGERSSIGNAYAPQNLMNTLATKGALWGAALAATLAHDKLKHFDPVAASEALMVEPGWAVRADAASAWDAGKISPAYHYY
jgi:hypothetical protein